MAKRTKNIIVSLLVTWLVFFIIDFSLSKVNKPPIFAIPTRIYKDGGSAEYYGLGYKVIKYVDMSAEEGLKIVKVDFGTWGMRFYKQKIN